MPNKPPEEEKDFLVGLVIGGIVGAGMAILLGSEEGKEVRKKIKRKGLELLDEITSQTSEIAEELEEIKNEVDQKTEPLQNQGKRLVSRLLHKKHKS